MMKAIIYVRVSTDEQAEKGYSLKHQEERLCSHCQQQGIEIVAIYKEDHSAKTFNRPAFTELLAFLKKNKAAVDLLLFLKWDRFSRNAGDAYGMINQLSKLGVEPQAIEQPLDLTIPENKIMLAFYLAAPEVENDRRSLNTIAGMRRAMKEGRHCTAAPKGYKNARNEQNKPIVVPGKDAHHLRFVFEKMSTGLYTVVEVSKQARANGFDCSTNQLWRILRNPFYCGKIIMSAYKNEEAAIVKGLHEPLVSEELFNAVQDIMDGRKRKGYKFYNQKEEYFLRGYLKCRRCGRSLTGSASVGNGGRYDYYHCTKGCPERIPAAEVNNAFLKGLKEISLMHEAIELFVAAMLDKKKLSAVDKQQATQEIQQEIDKNTARLKEAQRMRLDKEIDMAEYTEMKNTYEPVIKGLLQRQADLNKTDENLPKYARQCGELMKTLSDYFAALTPKGKQLIIGWIFPEKLIYEKGKFRTTMVDELILRICSLDAGLSGNKNGIFQFPIEKSHQVALNGFEPNSYNNQHFV